MAYCTITDVEGIESGRLQGSTFALVLTYPTAAQVGDFIDCINDEIDETIRRSGYETPIATPSNYLVRCNAMGAAWMVEISLNVSGNQDLMKVADQRYQSYQSMLKSIESNPRLAGAVPVQGTQDNIGSSDGVEHYVNDDQTLKFHIDKRDW